jgi:co-chaperonin GroES (HSP10)
LRPTEAPKEVSGLLLTQETAEKMRPQEGTVISIGPEVTQVEVGDVVTFSKYEGHQMELNEEILRICDEKDIYAVVLPS